MKKGFSLVEIMLVLAALGGIALLVTKLGKSTMEIQNNSLVMNDYNDLVRDTHFLLADSKSCKVSLQNLQFKVNEKNHLIDNVELWKADSKGVSKIKKIVSKSEKFKSLTIENVNLVIDDFSVSQKDTTDVIGTTSTLKVKVAMNSGRVSLSEIEHNLNISFKIDPNTSVATILNCDQVASNEASTSAKVWCGTLVNPCGNEIINAVGIGQFKSGLFTGNFQSLSVVDFKICTAAKNHPANFKTCEN